MILTCYIQANLLKNLIFKSKQKQLHGEMKLKLSHKRLFPIDSVK